MLKYDKLKHMEISKENNFDFICPSCKTNGMKKNNFTIKPIGISWRPDIVDNSDIKNPIVRKGYDKLPILREAILQAVAKSENTNNIIIHCNNCKMLVQTTAKITVPLMRKWVNKNHEFFIDLRARK